MSKTMLGNTGAQSGTTRETTLKVGAVIIIAAGIVVAAYVHAQMVQYWTFTAQDVARLLTPLILTSLFIERALEVLLTPWRGPDADELKRKIEAAKAEATADEASASSWEQKLLQHRASTRQLAFLTGLALGTLISALGLRAMQPFFEPKAFQTLPPTQQTLLTGIDVLVSGALLAGGADGLHKVVSVFTNFFDQTSDRIKGGKA